MYRKAFGIILIISAGGLLSLTGCGKESGADRKDSLVVFNYGDYIDRETIDLFEEETGIDVKYEEYLTPEDMYTKYSSDVIDYDLICTSEYMVEKMKQEGELLPLDKSGMDYYDNLDSRYLDLCQSFDPDNQYAVPYLWGTVGILYNEDMVEEEIDSWSILWNEDYRNQIVMQNSMRDAFLVPLKLNGHSLNTTDKEELREAQDMLMKQKPLVEAYLVDEIRDAMIAGDAAISVTYSGDATEAMDSNESLNYVVPKEGSNVWFDCWVIPKSCRHKREAELFIDFMNQEDTAMMNFDYIYYGTPNRAVYDALDKETQEDETIFPPEEVLKKCEVYQYLGSEADRYYTRLWKELKAR
ncbi:MAG: ABC transporter substrate-binding protein [Eubacterium sp.]|nr:ABC transporter substrate-binding protein [Eubacterium sp.]